MSRRRLLILGGTTEARELAMLAHTQLGDRLEIMTSLAGRTHDPLPIDGEVRSGGFGGAEGLETFLRDRKIDLLVDATHPFAERISRHARDAAAACQLPLVTVLRPPWAPVDGDRWTIVPDAAAAVAALPASGRRVWLTVGSTDLAAFATVPQTWFLVRRIAPPSEPLALPPVEVILGRGPFRLEDERRVISEHRIDCLICRNSGGEATAAKLVAARERGLPVLMIGRPAPSGTPTVETAAAALAWLTAQVNS